MTFTTLLDRIDALAVRPVNVEIHVMPFVREDSGQDNVYFVKAELDERVSRGHMKQFREATGVYSESRWVTEVRFAASLNTCWQRLVCCKELMHLYDRANAATNTRERFERLLNEMSIAPPPESRSEMHKAEARALWMALAVLGPRRLRDRYRPDHMAGKLTDYDVALALRIPERYVTHLMAPSFDDIEAALRAFDLPRAVAAE